MNKPTMTTTKEDLKAFLAKGAPAKGCRYAPIGVADGVEWFAVTSMWEGHPYVRVAYLYGKDVNDFYGGNGWDGALADGDDDYDDAGLTCLSDDADGLAEWALARFEALAGEAQ